MTKYFHNSEGRELPPEHAKIFFCKKHGKGPFIMDIGFRVEDHIEHHGIEFDTEELRELLSSTLDSLPLKTKL